MDRWAADERPAAAAEREQPRLRDRSGGIRREESYRLSRAEAQARVILETSVDTMVTFDRDGRLLSANPALARMFGYAEQDVIGRPFTMLVPSLKGFDFFRAARRPEEVGQSGITMEAMPVRADGTTFHAKLQIGMAEFDGGPLFACTISDCTAQKLFEAELLEAKAAAETGARAKTEFLAVISHEIRTPMNGVIGMTELLLETDLSDDQREYAENIRRSGEALLGVINGILDYATIESGDVEFDETQFQLQGCIREVFDLFASAAKRIGLGLTWRVDPKLSMPIVSDASKLKQTLIHLIGNAVKFTSEGGVHVEARLLYDHGDYLDIEFRVEDTGIGIPAGKSKMLFRPFSQIDSSMTRKYGGTGLGLAICKRLVGMLGGAIEIDPSREKGTAVLFTIRARRPMTPGPRGDGGKI